MVCYCEWKFCYVFVSLDFDVIYCLRLVTEKVSVHNFARLSDKWKI